LKRNGIAAHICTDQAELVSLLNEGAGAVLVTEEALAGSSTVTVADWVANQAA
jgi:hypothetical protein